MIDSSGNFEYIYLFTKYIKIRFAHEELKSEQKTGPIFRKFNQKQMLASLFLNSELFPYYFCLVTN